MLSRLRTAKVLGRAEREHQIRKALDAATRTIPGARWREDKALLDTVVNLTEFPSAILGSFDPQFLALPEEVLVTVMRDHQKYFAVEDAERKTGAAFSGGAEYGQRSAGTHPARQRARAAGALQRRAILLADGSEKVAAGAPGLAEECNVPERSRKLFRKDAARAAAVQLAERNSQADWSDGAAGRDPQGGLPVEDGSDHGVGEGIYRTAGDCGRAVRAGAATG